MFDEPSKMTLYEHCVHRQILGILEHQILHLQTIEVQLQFAPVGSQISRAASVAPHVNSAPTVAIIC